MKVITEMEKKYKEEAECLDSIKSFEEVDMLYEKGINLCKGCTYEKNASCDERRFDTCTLQLKKQSII